MEKLTLIRVTGSKRVNGDWARNFKTGSVTDGLLSIGTFIAVRKQLQSASKDSSLLMHHGDPQDDSFDFVLNCLK